MVWGLDAAVEGAGVRTRADAVQAPPLAVHAAVPPVLDGVVAAVPQPPGNLCPALAHVADHALDQEPLFGGDGVAVQ